MSDQIQKFERWRRLLSKDTAYFVQLVESEILPIYLERGYDRYGDYAGSGNWIVLQRRSGDEWPTVELVFPHRRRPFVQVHFAFLPDVCHTIFVDRPGFHEIPRIEAAVVDAPASFELCKGRKRNNDNAFGDASIFFRPPWLRRKLQYEIAELKRLSKWLIEFLDQGLPDEWLKRGTGGKVHPHIWMNHFSRGLRKVN
jgi:hypothetical protein